MNDHLISPEFSKTPSARTLYQLRYEIINIWEQKVREQVKFASQLQSPIIVDTVPIFLERLAEALCEQHPRFTATESTTISQEHGGERARLTHYGPDQFIQEYQILRDTVLQILQSHIQLTERDRRVIQISFDQALREGMLAFFLVQNQIREQFVAYLSHDLRNPLGTAKMSAELIQMIASEQPASRALEDIKNLAQKIINNSKRADRLIQSLLDASVIQFGEKLQLNVRPCTILEVVHESVNDLAKPEQERVRIQGEPAKGYWDGEAIRRALENLLNNAIKYGGAEAPITIEVRSREDRLFLSVHNEGSYIPVDEQEGLFQPFRRSEAARTGSTKGWGLGLALVRSVAEGHGGSVIVESSENTGTTFMMDFPMDARPYLEAPNSTGQ
ncbi:MAG: sensor histidine kinase [Pseudobdellovibrionaceae bacterium]